MLLVVNYAIEHPDEAKRLLTSFATGWLGLSGALLVASLVFRGKNTKGARFLRRLVLAAAGMLVPFALFRAYVFLSIHLTPVPYYQDTPNGVSVELVETLRDYHGSTGGASDWRCPMAVATRPGAGGRHVQERDRPVSARSRELVWFGGEDYGVSSRSRVAPAWTAVTPVTSRTGPVMTGPRSARQRLSAGRLLRARPPKNVRRAEAEQRACEKARAGPAKTPGECCWSVTDARSEAVQAQPVGARRDVAARATEGTSRWRSYQISLSSLGLPKLALQFEPFQKLAARLGSESAPRSDHPVGSSAVVQP